MRRARCLLLVPLLAVAACSWGRGDDHVRAVSARPIDAPPTTGAHTPTTTSATADDDRPSSCAPDALTPTDTGAGDGLFPELGNPGIDVQHYDVELTVDPSRPLTGTVGLDVVFTADRESFSLDADGPQVATVTVDGAPAAFTQEAAELVITPAKAPRRGDTVRLEVGYSVRTAPRRGADGMPEGWFTTADGSYVLNEPDGARTWLPSNDHPSDTASYRFTVHTTAGRSAVANGALLEHTGDTWVWEERLPMATYLIQLLTGDYELVTASGPHGLPLVHAVLAGDRPAVQPVLDLTAEQIAFFEQYFGPYPLDRYGLAITDSDPGLAMETLGRSLFSRHDLAVPGGEGQTVDAYRQLLTSHELAHQWFGDAVTLGRWRDIWLNESFATYAQWMWLEHAGFESVDQSAGSALASREPRSTADPSAAELFDFNSYDGGAVVLHALRRTIGDDAFFTTLREWVAAYRGMSCTTGGFIDLAEHASGHDLTSFFDTWLFADQLPSEFPPRLP